MLRQLPSLREGQLGRRSGSSGMVNDGERCEAKLNRLEKSHVAEHHRTKKGILNGKFLEPNEGIFRQAGASG